MRQKDRKRLARLARLEGRVESGGRVVPLLAPLREYDECMEFDRRVCGLGIKDFAWRVMPDEIPTRVSLVAGPEGLTESFAEEMRECMLDPGGVVVVSEVVPGFRLRRFVVLESKGSPGAWPGRHGDLGPEPRYDVARGSEFPNQNPATVA